MSQSQPPRAFTTPTRSASVVTTARVVVLILGAVVGILFLWVVIARFENPVDAEWMTGSVRESVERVRDGKQIYVAPSATFVPFVYTPLYVWFSAALARVFSVFVACKLVSLAATAFTAWGIGQLARIFGASRFWIAVGVLLHLGAYSATLFFYDIERVDAFASAVVIGALVMLLGGNGGTVRTALAGALFGLAFFAKQPGLFALVAAVSGLVLAREKRRAVIVAAVAAAVFAVTFAYLDVRTGGWFRYYCTKIPRSHGIEPALISTFFILDLPKVFVLAAGSAAVTIPVAWSALRRRVPPEGMPWREVVFAAVVAAGMAGAFFLRAHRGGWTNVIIAWTPLGCAAAAVAASRLERLAASTSLARPVSVLLLVGVALQLMGNAFDPNETAPDSGDKKASDRFARFVHKVEEQGEVIVTTRGGITRPSHFHAAALFDVVRAGDRAPDDYLSALRDRRYAALFVGSPDEFMCELASCKELSNATLQNYFVAARLEERPKTGMIGYDGRPRWVLRPRHTPLQALTRKELEAHMRQEMGIADMQRLAAAPEAEIVIDDGIEDLASHMTAPPEKSE